MADTWNRVGDVTLWGGSAMSVSIARIPVGKTLERIHAEIGVTAQAATLSPVGTPLSTVVGVGVCTVLDTHAIPSPLINGNNVNPPIERWLHWRTATFSLFNFAPRQLWGDTDIYAIPDAPDPYDIKAQVSNSDPTHVLGVYISWDIAPVPPADWQIRLSWSASSLMTV